MSESFVLAIAAAVLAFFVYAIGVRHRYDWIAGYDARRVQEPEAYARFFGRTLFIGACLLLLLAGLATLIARHWIVSALALLIVGGVAAALVFGGRRFST